MLKGFLLSKAHHLFISLQFREARYRSLSKFFAGLFYYFYWCISIAEVLLSDSWFHWNAWVTIFWIIRKQFRKARLLSDQFCDIICHNYLLLLCKLLRNVAESIFVLFIFIDGKVRRHCLWACLASSTYCMTIYVCVVCTDCLKFC